MVLSPSVLGERDTELLASERALADRLEACLKRFESSTEDAETLRRVVLALRELFLLVIAGEFNAGKSAFINALVGQRILAEGVTPTTAAITLLRYGEAEATRHRPDGLEERTHPAEFLRDIAIVDTPGTNAVLRHHEQLTSEFIPRSDLVLFVTSADRPFTESERQFLERIRDWGKKVVLILNKVDLLRTEDELDEVLAFIRQHAAQLLGHAPEVFPLSARLAHEARGAADGDEGVRLWQTSRMGALRDYLTRTLDDEGRARLKLLSPLGVMRKLTAKYLDEAQKRRALLDEDARTVANLESQLAAHRQDLEANFEQRLQGVTSLLLEMRLRGDRFFEDTVRLGRVIDLVQRERVRGAFVRDVVGDTPARIGAAVDELIDWMVEQEQRRWQDINDYLARRRRTASIVGAPGSEDEQVVGAIGATFDYTRRTVLRRVGHAAERDLATYDRDAEAAQLSASLQGAVAQTAVAGAGAIGLGVGLAVLVGTAAADFTGIVAGIVLASLGLGILPLHRRRARAQFDTRIEELRSRLETTLRDQFHKEMDGGELRLQEALAPYTRFVRVERERVEEILSALDQLQGELDALRHQIEG